MAVDLSVYDKIGQNSLSTLIRKREIEDATINKLNAYAMGGGGGNTPAAIQITNDLQKSFQEMQTNPDPVAREQAKQRYIMLQQVAKTYAIDRGMEPATPAYQGPNLNSTIQPMPQYAELDAELKRLENRPVPPSLPPVQGPPNPNQIPAVDNSLATQPARPMPAASGSPIRVASGYAGAKANIEGTVAGAKKQAEKDVELNMNAPIAASVKKAETLASPIPETAMAGIQEKEAVVSQLGGVNADLGKIVEAIGGNDLSLGPADNAASMVRNWADISNPNSRNYETLMTTLQRQRNASLLLAKGVQTDGDAVRAWSELMANLNDGALVSRRLQEIMKINERSAQLQQALANENRQNYGRGEKDFNQNFTQKPGVMMEKTAPSGFSPEKQKRLEELRAKAAAGKLDAQ